MRFLEGVFTKQERLALGFLIGAGLLGMGFQLFRLDRPPVQGYQPRPVVAVNRASAAELAALPGIGPVLAERILRDRKLHGRFLTLKDLSRVKGMTPKALEKLKGMLRFD
jgi:competence ComEA-like helix-hairpin-helix protein